MNFLSRPVISGFTSGSAIVIGLNQFGNLLGIGIERSNRAHELFLSVLKAIDNIHWTSLALGGGAVVLLLLLGKISKKIPSSLLVVVVGIALAYFLRLDRFGVSILGDIPKGFPEFRLPPIDLQLFTELLPLALTLALIGFMEAISVAKSVESKHGDYRVVPNKELIALGCSNMIGSLFQSYPATGGFARTAVNDQAGANTPLASLIAAGVIALTLLFLTPAFYFLPHSVLAGIIVVAAYGLLDFSMPKDLLSYNRRDLIILNVTLLVTVFFGVKEGILLGIVLSLAMLIYKTTKPHIAVLGQVPDTHFYRNVNRFSDLMVDPEILIVRFDAQLYFANTSYFKEKLQEFASEKGPALKLLIIDGESLNALDSSAIFALDEIHDYFTARRVTIAFSGLKGPVRDTLVHSRLMKKIRYDHCFMSIQEAVDCFHKDCFAQGNRYTFQEYTKQSNR